MSANLISYSGRALNAALRRPILLLACLSLYVPESSLQAQTWSTRVSNVDGDLVDVIFSSASTAVAVGQNAGGSGTLTVSGDGGVTWTDESGVLPNDDVNAVFADAATIVIIGDDLAGGSDALIFTSPDRGATWVQIATPAIPGANDENLNDGTFVNSSTAVAVGQNGEILRSVDRGASWSEVGGGVTAEDLNAVTFSGVTVVAAGDDAPPPDIVRSIDSGATWAVATTVPATGENLNDVEFINATTAIAVGNATTVLRSTDSGDVWTDVSPAGVGDLNAVASSGDVVVAVADGGNIARSADAGASWASFASVVTADNLRDVIFLTASVVLAVADADETIIRSTDAGLTWVLNNNNVGGEPLEALAFNSGNRTLAVGDDVAGGTDAVILLSLDQLTINAPIPFQSKWLLVALLVAYSIYALNRAR